MLKTIDHVSGQVRLYVITNKSVIDLERIIMASGDTLLIFTPQCNEPPAVDFATLDLRNSHLVLDFDATAIESAVGFEALLSPLG